MAHRHHSIICAMEGTFAGAGAIATFHALTCDVLVFVLAENGFALPTTVQRDSGKVKT